jgi:hypothetical protein
MIPPSAGTRRFNGGIHEVLLSAERVPDGAHVLAGMQGCERSPIFGYDNVVRAKGHVDGQSRLRRQQPPQGAGDNQQGQQSGQPSRNLLVESRCRPSCLSMTASSFKLARTLPNFDVS